MFVTSIFEKKYSRETLACTRLSFSPHKQRCKRAVKQQKSEKLREARRGEPVSIFQNTSNCPLPEKMFLVSKCLSNPYVVITQLFLICFPHHFSTCNRLETARETPEPCACMYVLFFLQVCAWVCRLFTELLTYIVRLIQIVPVTVRQVMPCTCSVSEGLCVSLLSHRKEKNPWKHLKNKAYLLKHRR